MLKKIGQWTKRTGEYSYAEFFELNQEAKELHLEFLKNLKPEELSSNDKAIMLTMKVQSKKESTKKFLEL